MKKHDDDGHNDLQVIKKATIFDDAEYKENLKELERRAREVKEELRAEEERNRQLMTREKPLKTDREKMPKDLLSPQIFQ